jgi:cell division protease FtsH
MSDDTARLIDREGNTLLNSCYDEAVKILTQKRALLEHLAEILLQVETLDGEEFGIIVDCSAAKEATVTETPVSDCDACSFKEQCGGGQAMRDGKEHAIAA